MKGYTIYLIHIEPRYRHAGHYLGITRNGREVAERFKEHHEGRGAILTRYARRAGCNLHLARVWFNAEFASERKMKGRSLAPLCPICKEKANEKDRNTSQHHKGGSKKTRHAAGKASNHPTGYEGKRVQTLRLGKGGTGVDTTRSFYPELGTHQHTAQITKHAPSIQAVAEYPSP